MVTPSPVPRVLLELHLEMEPRAPPCELIGFVAHCNQQMAAEVLCYF